MPPRQAVMTANRQGEDNAMSKDAQHEKRENAVDGRPAAIGQQPGGREAVETPANTPPPVARADMGRATPNDYRRDIQPPRGIRGGTGNMSAVEGLIKCTLCGYYAPVLNGVKDGEGRWYCTFGCWRTHRAVLELPRGARLRLLAQDGITHEPTCERDMRAALVAVVTFLWLCAGAMFLAMVTK